MEKRIEFKEIKLEDKALFDSYLRLYPSELSEMTFTNLFMWRELYKFRYTELYGHLCIISISDRIGPYCLQPIGECSVESLKKITESLYEHFVYNGWKLTFRKIPVQVKSNMEKLKIFDAIPLFAYDRDNCDYIYSVYDLIHLKGKKFDGKRNHINKFKKSYEYEYVSINNKELIPEAIRIMEEWCAIKNCDCKNGGNCERIANIELLNNFEILGCKGALIKVNGIYEAFTVGEMLNEDTAVIHIEKAKFSINGLYTMINQQFCEHEWSGAKFVNREQDLGEEGLRKAKLSYNPIKMIDKYIVTFQED